MKREDPSASAATSEPTAAGVAAGATSPAGSGGEEARAEDSYRQLVRLLLDDPNPCARERIEGVLRASGKRWSDLHADVEAARERRRLALASATIPELEVRCEIADEGFRLIHEAAERSRAEAALRESKAQEVVQDLLGRLEGARAAQRRLKQLLPRELVAGWEEAEERYREARHRFEAARRAGRNTEYVEAALHDAVAAFERAKAAALSW